MGCFLSQFINTDSLIKTDNKLNKVIPNLYTLIQDVHNKLKEKPQYIHIPLMDAVDDNEAPLARTFFESVSFFRPYWNMNLTDEHLQMIVGDYIGNDFWIGRFPRFYHEMSKGNSRNVGNILRNFRRRKMPNTLFFTVSGSTGYSQERWNLAKDQEQKGPFTNFGISYGRYPQIMEAFGIEKQAGFNTPVSSKNKVLLIGGTLDGRAPPSNIDTIAARFPNHQKIIIHNAGHNKMIDYEIMNGIIPFIQDTLKQDIQI